jgi:hypothetical protein
MADGIRKGAALEFTEAQLGGPCTEIEGYPVVGVVPGVLVPGNPDRVGLLIYNNGASAIVIALDPNTIGAFSTNLPGGGGFFECDVRTDFTLPARTWFASSLGGPVTAYVLQIIRYTAAPL